MEGLSRKQAAFIYGLANSAGMTKAELDSFIHEFTGGQCPGMDNLDKFHAHCLIRALQKITAKKNR